MKALIGVNRIPDNTTHFKVDIAMMKANGNIVQPATIPIQRFCHMAVKSGLMKQNCRC